MKLYFYIFGIIFTIVNCTTVKDIPLNYEGIAKADDFRDSLMSEGVDTLLVLKKVNYGGKSNYKDEIYFFWINKGEKYFKRFNNFERYSTQKILIDIFNYFYINKDEILAEELNTQNIIFSHYRATELYLYDSDKQIFMMEVPVFLFSSNMEKRRIIWLMFIQQEIFEIIRLDNCTVPSLPHD